MWESDCRDTYAWFLLCTRLYSLHLYHHVYICIWARTDIMAGVGFRNKWVIWMGMYLSQLTSSQGLTQMGRLQWHRSSLSPPVQSIATTMDLKWVVVSQNQNHLLYLLVCDLHPILSSFLPSSSLLAPSLIFLMLRAMRSCLWALVELRRSWSTSSDLTY